MSQSARSFEEALRGITAADPRYPLDAYVFVFEGLEYTLRKLGRCSGHVTGRELLEGIRDHALEQFGGLARLVFSQWDIRATDDFGEIVFNLVDAGLMGKTETDSREDFRGVYDFEEAFRFDHAAVDRPPAEREH